MSLHYLPSYTTQLKYANGLNYGYQSSKSNPIMHAPQIIVHEPLSPLKSPMGTSPGNMRAKSINQSFNTAILESLRTCLGVNHAKKILEQALTDSRYLPPSPISILQACANNIFCGDRVLELCFQWPGVSPSSSYEFGYGDKDFSMRQMNSTIPTSIFTNTLLEYAHRAFTPAALNPVLYKECLEELLRFSRKVVITKSLVTALSQKGDGKEVFKWILEIGRIGGREVSVDKWEMGDIVNIVREEFGNAVLGDMVDLLGGMVCITKMVLE